MPSPTLEPALKHCLPSLTFAGALRVRVDLMTWTRQLVPG